VLTAAHCFYSADEKKFRSWDDDKNPLYFDVGLNGLRSSAAERFKVYAAYVSYMYVLHDTFHASDWAIVVLQDDTDHHGFFGFGLFSRWAPMFHVTSYPQFKRDLTKGFFPMWEDECDAVVQWPDMGSDSPLRHFCDTQPSSSGGPLWQGDDHIIRGVHCTGSGVTMTNQASAVDDVLENELRAFRDFGSTYRGTVLVTVMVGRE